MAAWPRPHWCQPTVPISCGTKQSCTSKPFLPQVLTTLARHKEGVAGKTGKHGQGWGQGVRCLLSLSTSFLSPELRSQSGWGGVGTGTL